MTDPVIHVVIDRLVVEGIAIETHRRGTVADAFSTELIRLIHSGTSDFGPARALPSTPVQEVALPGRAGAADVGAAVGRGVFGAIGPRGGAE